MKSKKNANRIIVLSILTFCMTCIGMLNTTVLATNVTYINLDDKMTAAGNNISQDTGTVDFRKYVAGSNASILTMASPVPSTTFYEQIQFKENVMCQFKDHFHLNSPSSYALLDTATNTSTIPLVIEMKYKVKLDDYTVASPSAQLNIYIPNVISWKLGMPKIVPTKAEEDTWKTVKFVINPSTRKVYCNYNGAVATTSNFESATTAPMTDIRVYLLTLPASGGVIATDDGVKLLETPITWTFDYIKVYQLNQFGISSSTPANNQIGFQPSLPMALNFDTTMNTSTIISNNVNLQLVQGDVKTSVPAVVANKTSNSCSLQSLDVMEYFSNYELSLTNGVTDQYDFAQSTPSKIRFTTAPYPLPVDIQVDPATIILKNDGQVINSLASGNISADIPLKNLTAQKKDLNVVMALYKKDSISGLGRFESQVSKSISPETGEQKVVSTDILQIPNDSNYYIKIFVWNSQIGNYPITDFIICNMNGTPAISH